MTEFFLNVVNMSISASWLVCAVLLLRLLLKKAPKWINVLLWGIVAIRLICPFSFESVLSLIPSSQTINPEIALNSPVIDSGVTIIDNVINPIIGEATISLQPEKSVNLFQFIMPYLAGVWLVGIAALLVYTVISFLRLKSKIGTAVLLRDNIYQSEAVVSPFVLGVIKPKIYLPFNMNGQDMNHVIAHERAHIRRKDHLWKPLGFLILTLHWFNPMVWLGYILLCRDIELACDEKVVKELNNEQRADYSEALLACSVNRRMIAACPLAFGEVGVKDRIKSVLNYKKPAFWVIVTAIILTAVVALCFLTNPSQSTRDMLIPETEWQCKNFDLFFTVHDDGSVTGNISSPEYSGLISIGYRYAGKNAVAEIFKGDWDYAQQAAEVPLAAGTFRSKEGELHLDIEIDNAGINQQELIFFNNETATTSEATTPATEGTTHTEEESTAATNRSDVYGTPENPYQIGETARMKHGSPNNKDAHYDYNVTLTSVLTGTQAQQKLEEISTNFAEEKYMLETYDLYLANVVISFNEESNIKDTLPPDSGMLAMGKKLNMLFIESRFDIPQNSIRTENGEWNVWFPVLAPKDDSACLAFAVGSHQGAPGIISVACFALPE